MPATPGPSFNPAGVTVRRWLATATVWLPALLVLLPLLVVAWRSGMPAGEEWPRIAADRLPGYLRHTLGLITGVVFFSILLGVPAAWLVAAYQFPGRKVLEVALLLPIAMPGFIAAVAYVEAFREIIPFYVWIRKNFGIEAFLRSQEIMPWVFAIGVLSATLFPYVYLACRAAFAGQAAGPLEAARLLGAGGFRRFTTVALPMARPAIAAGASLVAMEAANDYGVVAHFGLSPLTPGIFRAWNEGQLISALRLALLLVAVVIVFLAAERWQRRRKRFSMDSPEVPLTRTRLCGPGILLAWFSCGLPLVLGFAIPCWCLVRWTLAAWEEMRWADYLRAAGNSFTLAAGATLLVMAGTLVLVAGHRACGGRSLLWARQVGILGYACPGALVAVGTGVIVSVLAFDFPGWASLALSASTFGLMFAYGVRFLAVGIQPATAGFERLPRGLHEAGRCLGAGPLRVLWQVDLPLVMPALVAGATLVFIDVFKELTMTLVLRPFDFETLSTLTFRLTDESRIPEAALPGLLIVLLSLPGLIPLVKLMRTSSR